MAQADPEKSKQLGGVKRIRLIEMLLTQAELPGSWDSEIISGPSSPSAIPGEKGGNEEISGKEAAI